MALALTTAALAALLCTTFGTALAPSATTVRGGGPSPPWSFPNARVLYQPALVRTEAARAVTPVEPGVGLTMLSLFGWTLGGVFVVEWNESPVGYYVSARDQRHLFHGINTLPTMPPSSTDHRPTIMQREVAVLSGLVARGVSIGAWVSHIVVTSQDAADGGRVHFGLPTHVGAIEFAPSEQTDSEGWRRDVRAALSQARAVAEDMAVVLKVAIGSAQPGLAEPAERLRPKMLAAEDDGRRGFVFDSGESVRIVGWGGWGSENGDNAGEGEASEAAEMGGGFPLPSFSGRLRSKRGDGGDAPPPSPLLRYPLRLGPARGFALRPSMPTIFSAGELSPELEAVLGGPVACPLIQVDGVSVVAGMPVEVA